MIINPEPLTSNLAKEKIKKLLKKTNFFLEYGSGGSTIYASKFCKKIISIETDYNFFKILKGMKINNTELIYVNVGKTMGYGVPKKSETLLFEDNFCAEYCQKPWSLMKKKNPDLVLIDGRYRVASILYSFIKNKNENCTYIFDDYINRPFYHIIYKYINIIEVCDNTIILKKKKQINLEELQKLLDIYYNDFR